MIKIVNNVLDPEHQNIIDKFAQYVAKNGPVFEEMTRQKQFNNPKFAFLFGKEYSQYYQYRLLQNCKFLLFMMIASFCSKTSRKFIYDGSRSTNSCQCSYAST